MWFIVRRKPSRLNNSGHSQEPLTTMPQCPSQSRGPCLLISRPDSCAPHVLWPRRQQQINRIRLRGRHILKQMTCSLENLEFALRRVRAHWEAHQPFRCPQCPLPAAKATCRECRRSGRPVGWDIRRGFWWRGWLLWSCKSRLLSQCLLCSSDFVDFFCNPLCFYCFCENVKCHFSLGILYSLIVKWSRLLILNGWTKDHSWALLYENY